MDITDFKALAASRQDYFNTVIAETNDHITRLAVMTAPYPWHHHPNSDETFIGVEGVVIIETEDNIYELAPGMVITIPCNIAHATRPKGERSVNLTVEHKNLTTVFTER